MRKVRVPVNNFQFGEISPSAISRTDSAVYAASAQRVENFLLRSEGGVIKRAGTERVYEYDITVEQTSFTITVSDYANIAVGTQIKFLTHDGTEITLESETSSGSSPSASSGNTHYFRPNESNNTTADNIYTAINAISGFTVANPSAAVVTVVRDYPQSSTNLTVSTTDSTRLTVTNFTGGSDTQSRLIPFIFSDDEQYIVSIENAKLRVFRVVQSTGVTSLVSTLTADVDTNAIPFDDAYIHEYSFAQSGDIMWICHSLFQPRLLVRTGATSFQLEVKAFDSLTSGSTVTDTFQPYYYFQDTGVTLSVNATAAGTGKTLTTSADYFVSGHVGTRFKYHDSEILITAVTNATTATGTILKTLQQTLINNAFRTASGSDVVEVTHVGHGFVGGETITISDAASVGGISTSNLNNAESITSIIDENTYTFTANGTANASEDGGGAAIKITTGAATLEWQEQTFSSVRGFPVAVTFHENRLVFGGTSSQPDAIWMSKTGEYWNFDVGEANDTDSIQLIAATGEVNEIRHLISNRDLQIFTASNELFVPTFLGNAITPTNAQLRKQTPYGSEWIRPESLDGATIFVQKNGAIVREYLFSDAEDSYTSSSISSISSHLIKTPVEQTALRGAINRNESYLFITNNDGTIAVFNSNRTEKRAGWVEFTTRGMFKSVVAIDDKVFCNIVIDTGAGTQKMILCEFKDTVNLDVAKTYTSTTGSFSVSSEFANGATVSVISNTNYYGDVVVGSGNADVSSVEAITTAEIGYKFDVTLKTNPLDFSADNGPVTGLPRALGSVFLDLNSTLAVSVNNTALTIRQVTDDMSKIRTPVTGKKEFRLLGYSNDPQIEITQSEPLPIQVNGLVAEVII